MGQGDISTRVESFPTWSKVRVGVTLVRCGVGAWGGGDLEEILEIWRSWKIWSAAYGLHEDLSCHLFIPSLALP